MNVLRLTGVSLKDHRSQLSCLANNNNITEPQTTTVVIDVRGKVGSDLVRVKPSSFEVLPKFVKISALEEEMVEGGQTEDGGRKDRRTWKLK